MSKATASSLSRSPRIKRCIILVCGGFGTISMRPYVMLPCPHYDLVQCFTVRQLATNVALRQFYQQRPHWLLNCFEIIESQQTVCPSYQDSVQSMQPLVSFLFVDFQVA